MKKEGYEEYNLSTRERKTLYDKILSESNSENFGRSCDAMQLL